MILIVTELTLFLIKSKDTACIIQVQILWSLVGLRMILCGMTSESLLPSALVSFGWCVLLYVPVSVSFYMCQWCECQTVICVREVGEWSNSKRQERSFRSSWIFFRDQTIGLLLNRGDVCIDNWSWPQLGILDLCCVILKKRVPFQIKDPPLMVMMSVLILKWLSASSVVDM